MIYDVKTNEIDDLPEGKETPDILSPSSPDPSDAIAERYLKELDLEELKKLRLDDENTWRLMEMYNRTLEGQPLTNTTEITGNAPDCIRNFFDMTDQNSPEHVAGFIKAIRGCSENMAEDVLNSEKLKYVNSSKLPAELKRAILSIVTSEGELHCQSIFSGIADAIETVMVNRQLGGLDALTLGEARDIYDAVRKERMSDKKLLTKQEHLRADSIRTILQRVYPDLDGIETELWRLRNSGSDWQTSINTQNAFLTKATENGFDITNLSASLPVATESSERKIKMARAKAIELHFKKALPKSLAAKINKNAAA